MRISKKDAKIKTTKWIARRDVLRASAAATTAIAGGLRLARSA